MTQVQVWAIIYLSLLCLCSQDVGCQNVASWEAEQVTSEARSAFGVRTDPGKGVHRLDRSQAAGVAYPEGPGPFLLLVDVANTHAVQGQTWLPILQRDNRDYHVRHFRSHDFRT